MIRCCALIFGMLVMFVVGFGLFLGFILFFKPSTPAHQKYNIPPVDWSRR